MLGSPSLVIAAKKLTFYLSHLAKVSQTLVVCECTEKEKRGAF